MPVFVANYATFIKRKKAGVNRWLPLSTTEALDFLQYLLKFHYNHSKKVLLVKQKLLTLTDVELSVVESGNPTSVDVVNRRLIFFVNHDIFNA